MMVERIEPITAAVNNLYTIAPMTMTLGRGTWMLRYRMQVHVAAIPPYRCGGAITLRGQGKLEMATLSATLALECDDEHFEIKEWDECIVLDAWRVVRGNGAVLQAIVEMAEPGDIELRFKSSHAGVAFTLSDITAIATLVA